MPRSDIIVSEEESPLQQLAEFNISIAINTGIGRFPFLIGICKSFHYVPSEMQPEIKHVMAKTQTPGYNLRILHVGDGAAGPCPIVDAQIFIVVELQRGPADIVALFLQQRAATELSTPPLIATITFFFIIYKPFC